MSESKFTPGPWKKCTCGYCELVYGADGETTIHTSPDNSETRTAEGEESQANARLIAAAPDMYEALKYFEAYMEGPRDLQSLLIMVDSAIAKAEGKDA